MQYKAALCKQSLAVVWQQASSAFFQDVQCFLFTIFFCLNNKTRSNFHSVIFVNRAVLKAQPSCTAVCDCWFWQGLGVYENFRPTGGRKLWRTKSPALGLFRVKHLLASFDCGVSGPRLVPHAFAQPEMSTFLGLKGFFYLRMRGGAFKSGGPKNGFSVVCKVEPQRH